MQVVSSLHFAPRSIDTPEGRFKIIDIVGRNGQITPGPQCFLTEVCSDAIVVQPHFHKVEQFQLFVAGTGHFGKRPLSDPMTVHYADRFTPYGPIRPDASGFQYMTFRLKADPGPRPMPQARAEKTEATGRSLTCCCVVAEAAPPGEGRRDLLADEADGLRVEVVNCLPHREFAGPDPTLVPGQYYVVVAGAIVGERGPLPKLSTIFLDRHDERPRFLAGPQGLTILRLVFPTGAVFG